ncbi:MAG: hypothetical protein ABI654_11400 [Betaproteobacteria bacterium]
MTTHKPEQEIGSQIALVALVVVGCIAGIPPIVDYFARSLAPFGPVAAGATLACGSCGVVEAVREVTLNAPTQGVSTVAGEGFAMFFGLMTGKLDTGAVKIHEIEVRMRDGSTRVIREGAAPAWKPGDHVRIVMGRIRPTSS